jgi:hypothetical protein
MPIGTVDYTSTAPWNDPLNPFPALFQVCVSGMALDDAGDPFYANNEVLSMTYFNPLSVIENTGGVTCRFASADNLWQLDLNVVQMPDYDAGLEWVLNYLEGATAQYTNYPTMSRGVPYKTLIGTNQGWIDNVGTGIEGLLILPVTTALTPWEFRRRRLLEYV